MLVNAREVIPLSPKDVLSHVPTEFPLFLWKGLVVNEYIASVGKKKKKPTHILRIKVSNTLFTAKKKANVEKHNCR